MSDPQVIVISGDFPREMFDHEIRNQTRLNFNGQPATLGFLKQYFECGRDAEAATRQYRRTPFQFLSINGPFLCQHLERNGITAKLVPNFTTHRDRLVELLQRNPAAAVISTTFLSGPKHIDEIASFIKQLCPACKVIVGGINIWKAYKTRELMLQGVFEADILDALKRDAYLLDLERPSPADIFVISASGEGTLVKVMQRLLAGKACRDIPNLACLVDGKLRFSEIVPEPGDGASVDWSHEDFGMPQAFYPIQSGAGCRFRCQFCDFVDLRAFSMRSIESIIAEIRTVPEIDGLRRINFTDENLFSSRARTRELCRGLLDAGLKLRWRSFVRVDIVNGELAELMAASGCDELLLGIESGDAEMLKRMQKGSTPEKILSGVNCLNQHGINAQSTFVVGFPGETERSVQNTIDLLNAYPTAGPGMQRYYMFTFALLPLAPVFARESREKYGLKGYLGNWTHSTMTRPEADRQMIRVHDEVKPEVSPVYLEMGEVPGATVSQRKAINELRTWIKRCQRGLLPGETEAALWDRLESAVREL